MKDNNRLPRVKPSESKERKKRKSVKINTYRTSNTLLQAYTGEGKMVHYDYNTQELADEEKVSIVNYNTGAEEYLTTTDYDLLNIFAELISPSLDDPKVQEYLRELSSTIFLRQEESESMRFEIEETKIPKIKNMNLWYLARKKFNTPKVGGNNLSDLALALDSLSRKGCDFTFYNWNEKTHEKEIVLQLRSRFFHIKYHPKSKRTKTRLVTLIDEEGKPLRGEDKKVIKTEENTNIYSKFDIVLEEVYFWFYGGYFLQPINIRAIKKETKYPTNELANWLYFFIVGQRGNYIKRTRDALRKMEAEFKREARKKKEEELKQNKDLTEEERTELLTEYMKVFCTDKEMEAQLKAEERKRLTLDISVKFIMERLKGSSYHREGGDITYNFYGVFDDQLPEVLEGLKRVGIIVDYYIKGKGEDRVLYFVYNKEWLKDNDMAVETPTLPSPSDEGIEVES